MAKDIRSLSKHARLAYGLGCLALGSYPIALSLGYVQIEESASTAPPWVIAGAGFVFVIAGFMILLANHSRANNLLAGVLLMVFGIMGIWVSLFSSSEGFSGGLPFLSQDLNILIGRCLFGLGAIISFALSAWAFRRGVSGSN